MEDKQSKAKITRMASQVGQTEKLPFRIEVWTTGKSDAVERVLARAFNAQLARAIFKAAVSEHPKRRVMLRRGTRIIADSAS
jgi:hypothetical protein